MKLNYVIILLSIILLNVIAVMIFNGCSRKEDMCCKAEFSFESNEEFKVKYPSVWKTKF